MKNNSTYDVVDNGLAIVRKIAHLAVSLNNDSTTATSTEATVIHIETKRALQRAASTVLRVTMNMAMPSVDSF